MTVNRAKEVQKKYENGENHEKTDLTIKKYIELQSKNIL